jgi:DNA (cytosine-5)-methyltransferase 1
MPPDVVIYPDKARSLTARYDSSPCVDRGQNFVAIENHAQDSRFKLSGEVFQTLPGKMGTGGNNTPMVMYNIQDHAEPIPINDKATRHKGSVSANGLGVGKSGDPAPTITTSDRHAVAIDCRNLRERKEVSGTLQAKTSGGYSLNYQNPIRSGFRVRRLTPLECCRLQGFPDYWAQGLDTPRPTPEEINRWLKVFEDFRIATNPHKKAKTQKQVAKWLKHPHSDGAEYKMWGNSLAIPCAYTVLSGIADELRKEAGE